MRGSLCVGSTKTFCDASRMGQVGTTGPARSRNAVIRRSALPGETEAQCVERKRENTSAAFFLSPEFQNTGYFVLRVYRGSLGRMPHFGGAGTANDEFTRDARNSVGGNRGEQRAVAGCDQCEQAGVCKCSL